jgi:metal-responsive CopG/Arc/MetJ family transcriptional regulator
MAARKMTFTLPEELAARFVKRVGARDRSRYVAAALAEKLSQREKRLIRACEIVNADPAVREIEEEFDALNDEIAEPWENAPTR